MFKVGTNYQSMVAQRRLGQLRQAEQEEMTKLSSGSRIALSYLDPAGTAIATGMRAKSISNSQLQRNANDGISLLQVAEGTLGVLHGIGGRLRELAMQAANDTVGPSERSVANKEFQEMIQEIKRLTDSTKFNGKHVINGNNSTYDLQIGLHNNPETDRLNYDLRKVLDSANNFGLTGANILSKEGALSSFSKIDSMINEVSKSRAKLGGSMNRIQSAITNLQISKENLEASKTKIADADIAAETANNARTTIMKDATTSLLMQANNRPALAAKLIDA